MWTEPWLPEHTPRPPRLLGMPSTNTVGIGWNIDKISEDVMPEDVEKILGLKISSKARCDQSGYWLSFHLPTNVPVMPTYGNPQVKHQIWKCKSPPKIKHFFWRLISKSLATGSNLRRLAYYKI